MQATANYPSVTEDNRGVFEILVKTLVVAKRKGVEWEMAGHLHAIGIEHDIDIWDLDEASDLELNQAAK